jgi:hypothetical protein
MKVTHALFFLICLHLKMGPIGYPEMVVRNYHSTPRKAQISHDSLAMHALVWLYMLQFKAIQYSKVQFTTSYANFLRQPHIFRCQISETNPHLAFK